MAQDRWSELCKSICSDKLQISQISLTVNSSAFWYPFDTTLSDVCGTCLLQRTASNIIAKTWHANGN